jgi:predicted acylesterase/phospholipase RssA
LGHVDEQRVELLQGHRGAPAHTGEDLGAADLIVGTSARAIVGALLARGGDLDRLATLPVGVWLASEAAQRIRAVWSHKRAGERRNFPPHME